jgi:hypothetical protein
VVKLTKDEIEEIAAAVVVRETRADRFERRDFRGGGFQIRDFVVVHCDGRTEPMEVTSHVDEEWMGFWATVNKHPWNDPEGLERCWIARLDQSVRLKTSRDQIIAFLSVLESAGETVMNGRHDPRFWNPRDSSPPALAIRGLVSLGVEHASSVVYPDDVPERFVTIASGEGGVVDPEMLVGIAERCAALEDNRAKLRGFDDAEYRHLAVMVPASAFEGWRALQPDMDPPVAAPVLPDEINSVWLIVPGQHGVRFSDGQWTRIEGVAA